MTKETDNGTKESCLERSGKDREERCNTELDIAQDFDVVPAELACEQHNGHGEGGSGKLFGKSETVIHHDDRQPEKGPITPVRMGSDDRRVMAEYPWLAPLCNLPVDTLFNVCLEVTDVEKTSRAMVAAGSDLLLKPQTIFSKEGKVQLSVVSSPCDNIIHSLVNTSDYSGSFLPGFTMTDDDSAGELEEDLLADIDHVTYVCREGESLKILAFYKETCGMERFLVDPMEEVATGVEIGEEVGLRLMAGQWLSEWLCHEQGLRWPSKDTSKETSKNMFKHTFKDTSKDVFSDSSNNKSQTSHHFESDDIPHRTIRPDANFKLVLAEPLPNSPHSHVNTFLKAHGGPGLQHIGLSTLSMAPTVGLLTARGAMFRKPPPTYYHLQGKKEQITALMEDPEIFKGLGILIDPEVGEGRPGDCLLQIFSTPLFKENTFFLEVIERRGSCRGFGAGNIQALALSIVMMQRQKESEREERNERSLTQSEP